MDKLQRPIYYTGLVVVAIGAFGLLTSRWSNEVSAFFTVFGFMMSFAKVFAGLPLFSHPQKAINEQAPVNKVPYLPEGPLPVTKGRGVYLASGISLILGSMFLLISSILLIVVISNPRGLILIFFLSLVTNLIAGIFIPVGLPGLHMRQADRAGTLGLIGIIVVIIGWLASDLINILVIAIPFRLVPVQILPILQDVTIPLTILFVLGGNTLLGIAIIRAGIFPRWMGIVSVVVGIVSLLLVLYPGSSLIVNEIDSAINSISGMFIAAFYVRGGYIIFFYAKNSKPDVALAPQLPSMPNYQPTVAIPSSSNVPTIWGYLLFSTGRQIQLSGARVSVGRSNYAISSGNPEIDLTSLPEGNTVSHFHAAIEHNSGACTVTDLNSKNFTFINGKRLEPERPSIINDRDMLYFGRVSCTFRKV